MNTLINVAFPVFAIIGIGYLAGWRGILGSDSAAALNRFVYYFALPPVLFLFTARAPIEAILNWPFIGAFLLGTILTLALALIVGRLVFGHDASGLAMHGFTAVFSNTAYMGIPLFLTAFGDEGALPAIVATLAGNTLLVGGVIAAMEATRAKGPSTWDIVREVSVTLCRNPLLVAPFLGIGFSMLDIGLVKPVANFLDLMAASAGPAALFALGLSLVGKPLTGHMKEVSCLVLLKVLVQPIVTYLLVEYVFDLEPIWAKGAILLSALPAGALVFVVAQQYDLHVNRASAAIVLSTAVSVITVSGLLILLEIG